MGNSGVKEGSNNIEFITNATATKQHKPKSRRRLADGRIKGPHQKDDIEVVIIWNEGGSNILLAADFFDNWTRYEPMERHGNIFKLLIVN